MTRRQLFIFLFGILALIVLVGVTVSYFVGLSEAFGASLTAALVYATAYYAFLTSEAVRAARQSATITNRQAEIILNAEFNAMAPVIKLEAAGRKKITVSYENVGRGPALNFRCWIEDEEHPELRAKMISRTAIARDEKDSFVFDTRIPGYEFGIGYLKTAYDSVFMKPYESCLFFTGNEPPHLEYGQSNNTSTGAGMNPSNMDLKEKINIFLRAMSMENSLLQSYRAMFIALAALLLAALIALTAHYDNRWLALIGIPGVSICVMWIILCIAKGKDVDHWRDSIINACQGTEFEALFSYLQPSSGFAREGGRLTRTWFNWLMPALLIALWAGLCMWLVFLKG